MVRFSCTDPLTVSPSVRLLRYLKNGARKLLLNINGKLYDIYQMYVSFPVTLSDPSPDFKVMVLFKDEYLKKAYFVLFNCS